MTFPFTFPHVFGTDSSPISPKSGLPITGWWPDINVGFALAVPPSFGASGFAPLRSPISVPASLAFTAALRQPAAFSLAVPPSLVGAGAPIGRGAFGLSLPASLAFTGAPVQPGGFTLAVPPSLTPAGVPVQPGALGLSLPPSLAFTGLQTVAYDATGTGNHALLTSAGITNAHTLGANATAILVGVSNFISSNGFANVTSNSCLLGSTPLTLLGHIDDNITGQGWTEVWGAIFAAGTFTGAQTITYKEAAGASFPFTLINSVSYSGVTSFGTPVTNIGASTSLSTGSVGSAIGNRVFAAIGGGGSAHPLSLSGSGTQRWLPANPGGYINLLLQDIAGNTTVTETATVGAAVNWGAVAVNLL